MTTLLQFLRDFVLAFLGPRAALVAENLLLRQQVVALRRQVKRPRLRPFDRWLVATLAGRFRDLLTAVLVVKPETLIRRFLAHPATRSRGSIDARKMWLVVRAEPGGLPVY